MSNQSLYYSSLEYEKLNKNIILVSETLAMIHNEQAKINRKQLKEMERLNKTIKEKEIIVNMEGLFLINESLHDLSKSLFVIAFYNIILIIFFFFFK